MATTKRTCFDSEDEVAPQPTKRFRRRSRSPARLGYFDWFFGDARFATLPDLPDSANSAEERQLAHMDSALALAQQATNAYEDEFWALIHTGDRDTRAVLEVIREQPAVLRRRGPLGETPLHLLVLYRHFGLARGLAARYPELLTDQYLEEEYRGETCLHIAIIHKAVDVVRFILHACKQHGILEKVLEMKADGEFFQRGKPCYYGGFPLSFAVSTNQVTIVHEMVRSYGARLDVTDVYGNNLLHLCVEHQLPEMYDVIQSLWADQAPCDDSTIPLTHRPNLDGHVPLCTAAKLGYCNIFNHMLQASCEVQWEFGPVKSVLLPLENLDYIPGRASGAVEHIIREGHLDLLMLPFIQELLSRKWNSFAGQKFREKFWQASARAIVFSVMVILPEPWWVHAPCKFFVVFSSLQKLRVELQEMWVSSLDSYLDIGGAALFENICSLLYCVLFLISQALEQLGPRCDWYANFALACSGLLCWLYLLWFLLGWHITGHLVVMIWKIVLGDFIAFAGLIIIVLMGFSLALFTATTSSGTRDLEGFAGSFFEAFLMILGGLDKDAHPEAGIGYRLLLVSYSVLVTVLLLNILVAMMNDTFTKISDSADTVWQLERARIIASVEQELPELNEALLEVPQKHDCGKEHLRLAYWLTIRGKRFLQMDIVRPRHDSKT